MSGYGGGGGGASIASFSFYTSPSSGVNNNNNKINLRQRNKDWLKPMGLLKHSHAKATSGGGSDTEQAIRQEAR